MAFKGSESVFLSFPHAKMAMSDYNGTLETLQSDQNIEHFFMPVILSIVYYKQKMC